MHIPFQIVNLANGNKALTDEAIIRRCFVCVTLSNNRVTLATIKKSFVSWNKQKIS